MRNWKRWGFERLSQNGSGVFRRGVWIDSGIADSDLVWIDRIGPDFKEGEAGLALNGGERPIHSVCPMGNFDAANAWEVETWIEGEPFLAEVNFAVGVKIHG